MVRSRLAGRIAALLFPAAVGALLFAAPGHAEIVASDERGFVVRQTADVGISAPEAWRVLVKPATWWLSEHTFSGDAVNLMLDPVAGGCFCEKLPPAKQGGAGALPGSVQHMRVIYAEPGRALRLSGALGPLQSEAMLGVLTMTLKSNERGTRILFEYVVGGYMRYRPDQIAPAVDRMLGQQVAHLADKLGGALAADGTVPIVTPSTSVGRDAAAPTVRSAPQGPSLDPDGAPVRARPSGALRGLPALPRQRTTTPPVDDDDGLDVSGGIGADAAVSPPKPVAAKAAPVKSVPAKPALAKAPAARGVAKPAAAAGNGAAVAKPAPVRTPPAKPVSAKPAPPKASARPATVAPRDEAAAQKDAQAAFDAALGGDTDH